MTIKQFLVLFSFLGSINIASWAADIGNGVSASGFDRHEQKEKNWETCRAQIKGNRINHCIEMTNKLTKFTWAAMACGATCLAMQNTGPIITLITFSTFAVMPRINPQFFNVEKWHADVVKLFDAIHDIGQKSAGNKAAMKMALHELPRNHSLRIIIRELQKTLPGDDDEILEALINRAKGHEDELIFIDGNPNNVRKIGQFLRVFRGLLWRGFEEALEEQGESLIYLSEECVCCNNNTAEIVAWPCGHQCYCFECADKITLRACQGGLPLECPICRREIQKFKLPSDIFQPND